MSVDKYLSNQATYDSINQSSYIFAKPQKSSFLHLKLHVTKYVRSKVAPNG